MNPGDNVWIDEGDSAGCFEFGGVVETVYEDGSLDVRVSSTPIVVGAATNSLRHVDPQYVSVDVIS
jgi:hypothetical protein